MGCGSKPRFNVYGIRVISDSHTCYDFHDYLNYYGDRYHYRCYGDFDIGYNAAYNYQEVRATVARLSGF